MVKFKRNYILLGDIVVMIEIKSIMDSNEKSKITNYILRELPEWFGIEESIVEYVEEVKQYDFYGAYNQEEVMGFISIKYNNKYTAEVYLIGILKEYQNNHIGRRLIEVAEEVLIKNKIKLFMVKTLGESHPDENYKITREFYKKLGFYPLEEIKEIWGESNPCLIMVKTL